MDYPTLGRTGLKVSVMGIGCGGPSQVGKHTGKSEAESVAIVRQAIDSGVNFIDTAEVYGTEEIVGKAIKNIDRRSVVISTKKGFRQGSPPGDVRKGIEESLSKLGTDYVDIYHLHWDVLMVGFNILNQTASKNVFPITIKKNIGVLVMQPVRYAFSRPDMLKQVIHELIEKKQFDQNDIYNKYPLDFLIHDGGAISLLDASFRFCRYEPGAHVVLSGTGNSVHLMENIASFSRPPLPSSDLERIKHIFRNVDSATSILD